MSSINSQLIRALSNNQDILGLVFGKIRKYKFCLKSTGPCQGTGSTDTVEPDMTHVAKLQSNRLPNVYVFI